MQGQEGVVSAASVFGFFDWVIVAIAPFRDAWVGAFASSVGDAFQDLGDDFCNGFLKYAGGKMPPG